jgi:hypothetical protein
MPRSGPFRLRQPGSYLLLSLLAAGCSSSPADEPPEPDTLTLEFGRPTPAQLVALELPEGCRPGDRLRNSRRDDPSVQLRIAYGHLWQTAPQPERNVYRVDAYGRNHRIGLVQVALADEHQTPIAEFAAAAGIELGDVVGHATLPYCRNRGTMSQDHLAGITRPGVMLATNRDHLFLVAREGKIDSVLWIGDETLLPQIPAILFRTVFKPVRECLARQDAKAALAAMEALKTFQWEAVPPAVKAEEQQLWQAVRAAAAGQDAAPRAAFDRNLAAAQQEIEAAHPYAAIGLYKARLQQLDAQAQGIALDRPATAAPLFGSLQKAARRHVEGRPPQTPSDIAYKFLAEQAQGWTAETSALVDQALACERAGDYGDALAAVGAFERALKQGGDLTAQYEGMFRALVAAAVARQAEALRAARRPSAASHYEALAARLRNGETDLDGNRTEDSAGVAAFAARLDAYDAIAGADARIAWVIAQVPTVRCFRGSGLQQGNNYREILQNLFLTDLVKPRFDQEVGLAEAARGRGLPATAARHELMAAAIAGQHPWRPVPLGAAFDPAPAPAGSVLRSLQTLAPLLRTMLPPIGPTTAEGQRLVELLREVPSLDWPLVRLHVLSMAPGDLSTPAALAGAPAKHAALVQRGETFVLELRDAPQGLGEDTSFLQRLSGISPETQAESRALAAESAAIDAERQAIDAERQTIEPQGSALDAAEKAIEAERAGSTASAEAGRAFNQKVDAHNARVRELRPKQDALRARIAAQNGRVAAYNARVSVNNERRMRERAAGGAKVDGLLRSALDQWFTERFGLYEAALRTAGHDDAAVAQEMDLARWLFGRVDGSRLPSFAAFEPEGLKVLRREAIERTIHQQPTNEALARAVVEHFVLAVRPSDATAGEAFFRQWAKTFRWERDIKVLQQAIAAETRLSPWQRQQLQRLLAEAEQR